MAYYDVFCGAIRWYTILLGDKRDGILPVGSKYSVMVNVYHPGGITIEIGMV